LGEGDSAVGGRGGGTGGIAVGSGEEAGEGRAMPGSLFLPESKIAAAPATTKTPNAISKSHRTGIAFGLGYGGVLNRAGLAVDERHSLVRVRVNFLGVQIAILSGGPSRATT
jgi:hypothetical protein